MPCDQSKYMEQRRRYGSWFGAARKPCVRVHIALPAGYTQLPSTWKARLLLKLLTTSRSTAPRSPSGCGIGKRMEWMGFWKDIDPDDPRKSPILKGEGSLIFSTVAPSPMDSLPVSGRVLWSPVSLKRNFPSPIIPPMFPVSSMPLAFRYSVPQKPWQKLTKLKKTVGRDINTPVLKKNQKRRRG